MFALVKISAVLLAGALMLTACDKTPSTPPVVGKNNGVLEKKLTETAPKGRYNAPQSWKASYTHGKLTVDIDATIETPDVDAYPVFEVAPDELTQDKVDQLVKVLMQGKTIYPYRQTDGDGDNMTKSEILQEIAYLEAGANSDLKKSDPNAYVAFIKSRVDTLNKKLATTPDNIERKPSDGKLTAIVNPTIALQEQFNWNANTSRPVDSDPAKYPNYKGLNVEADLGNNHPANLALQKSPDDKDDRISFSSGSIVTKSLMAAWETPPKLTIPWEQGAQTAKKLVADLGQNDMKLVETSPPAQTGADAYAYHFIRTVQGLTLNYRDNPSDRYRIGGGDDASAQQSSSSSGTGGGSQSDPAYAQPWTDETLEIDVDNTGVRFLYWNYPEKVGKAITKNAELLPFDQLEQIFAKDMEYQGVIADDPLGLVVSRTIHITKISLGLVKAPVKDHPGTFMLVPAWELYGDCTDKMSDKVQNTELDANHEYVYSSTPYTSYATVNAIDGTLIERASMSGTGAISPTNQISADK